MSARSRWLGVALFAAALLAALGACSGRRLPPGTPPPEYEPPQVPPWTGTAESSDAGPAANGARAADSTIAVDAGVGTELSLDAGSR